MFLFNDNPGLNHLGVFIALSLLHPLGFTKKGLVSK